MHLFHLKFVMINILDVNENTNNCTTIMSQKNRKGNYHGRCVEKDEVKESRAEEE